ncbi:potassium transporter Trk [Nocardiopsis sp. NPDC050513]|uniref:potassium transporter Trk n=1 Tax=Nocardiopsis sp. NPDC050513 TaxID=3364338 RepID=UPI003799CDC4
MADILPVLAALGFFALCAAYVRGCERVVGADRAPQVPPDPLERPERDAAVNR